ncbi:MAG: NADH-quinone oxidoreductase subunit A [Acidimicrobiia bacterium]
MDQYLPLAALFGLAIGFGIFSVLVSKALSPKRPSMAKSAPYECGIVPQRDPPQRFPVRFYLVAMIFIVFDIEIIFLYPYAVVHRDLGAVGLWELGMFSLAVFAAFIYLIGNGALDWGPVKRARSTDESDMVSAGRTAATTVRRVGLEGRHDPEAA